jgi:hypothetical protein
MRFQRPIAFDDRSGRIVENASHRYFSEFLDDRLVHIDRGHRPFSRFPRAVPPSPPLFADVARVSTPRPLLSGSGRCSPSLIIADSGK